MNRAPAIAPIDAARRVRSGPPRIAELRLERDEVEIWRVDLDELDDETGRHLAQLLSEDEAQRAERFFFERDRRRAMATRGVLRLLLGGYTGRAPRELRFDHGDHGKPVLRSAGEPTVQFNVTHAEGLALFAFTRTGDVGIDAERIRHVPDWEAICGTCFSSAEAARIHRVPAEQRPEEFLRAWTRHEALLKARGVGLTGGVASSDLRCQTGGPAAADAAAAWRLLPVDAGPEFVATLAIGPAVRWATARTWCIEQTGPKFMPQRGGAVSPPPTSTEISFP